ncbi:ABC transporter, permease protein, partial [Candidatus Burkholderia humilis]
EVLRLGDDGLLPRQRAVADCDRRGEFRRDALVRHAPAARFHAALVCAGVERFSAFERAARHAGSGRRGRAPVDRARRARRVCARPRAVSRQALRHADLPAPADGPARHLRHSDGDRHVQVPPRRHADGRDPRESGACAAVRDSGDDPVHRTDRSESGIGGPHFRGEHDEVFPLCAVATARSGYARGRLARAGAHHRHVRADLLHRGADHANARRRAVLRGVLDRRARTAIHRRHGDDLHGHHARLGADRAAVRESDAARVAREGATLVGAPPPPPPRPPPRSDRWL